MTNLERYRAGDDLVELVRRDFAPNAPVPVIGYFLRVSEHRGLDPWRQEIALVSRTNRRTGEISWHYEVTIAGRRLIAQRSGRLLGIGPPSWCAPRRHSPDGEKLPLVWEQIWDDDVEPPYCARVEVYVVGWTVPSVGVSKWSETAQFLDPERKRLNPFWAKAPAHQLAKCAESLALRRGFAEIQAAVADEKQPLGMFEPDNPILAETQADRPPTRAALQKPDANATADVAFATPDDQVPASVYDREPEALGVGVEHAYRYDDPEDPGRPF